MMKTIKLIGLLVLALGISFSISSCTGEEGPAGKQGNIGPIGPAGNDGSKIYSGEGNPENNIGLVGDYYLDRTTSTLYGPKLKNDNWNSVVTLLLKGDKGENGAEGSKIHSGEGNPTVDLGKVGDYYLNITNCTLYGPKKNSEDSSLASVWGLGLELKGAEGNANVNTYLLTIDKSDWGLYSNIVGTDYKLAYYDFSPNFLTDDILKNGIILVYMKTGSSNTLLPKIDITHKKNLIQYNFSFYKYSTSVNKMSIKESIKVINDASELIVASTCFFRIKVVSGKPAQLLTKVQNDAEEFNKIANELNILD